MRAIRRFTVRTALPEPLAPARATWSMNLRWSWHPETRDLFACGRPGGVARRSSDDPVRLLGEVVHGAARRARRDRRLPAPARRRARASSQRLPDRAALVPDAGGRRPATAPPCDRLLLARVRHHARSCRSTPAASASSPATTSRRPATSACRSSASGCSTAAATSGSRCRATAGSRSATRSSTRNGLPLTQLRDADGAPLEVAVVLPGGRTLHAQVWKAQVGRVPLLLLDSDVEDNDAGRARGHRPALRRRHASTGSCRRCCSASAACARCGPTAGSPAPRPGGVPHQRGPRRLPRRSSASASCTEDRARPSTRRVEAVRAGTVFTTHTPVPAGIDRFPRELVAQHFGGDNAAARRARRPDPGARRRDLRRRRPRRLQHGRAWGCAWPSGPTASPSCTARSAAAMFAGLWPGFDADEVPIASITNGVHAPTWVAREVMRAGGAGRSAATSSRRPRGWEAIDAGRRRRRSGRPRRTLRGAPGRGGPPPAARVVAAARGQRGRARLDRRRPRPRRRSPSASPGACRRTSGSR